jgi:hypothetical protein
MADKLLLLHPDDFEHLKAAGQPIHDESRELTSDLRIHIARDNLGVCRPGEGFEVNLLRLMDRIRDDVFSACQVPACMLYGREMAMPPPPKFMALDLLTDIEPVFTTPTPWVPLSLKKRARLQRRLDYQSNNRRRKRWAELFERESVRP